MLPTFLVIALLVGLVVSAWLTLALFLRLGLRWGKVEGVTWRRIAAAATLVIGLQAACLTAGHFALPFGAMLAVPLLIATVVPLLVIRGFLKAPLRRNFRVWLPAFFSPVAVAAIVLPGMFIFVCKKFTIPTNAMAPTLLGNHGEGTCRQCGSPAYYSLYRDQFRAPNSPPSNSGWMICERNFHVTPVTSPGEQILGGDHILTTKILKPQRWDLIVFAYPDSPTITYVKRLVGLPGEVITIRDGSAWADGEKLTPPENLSGLEYLSAIEPPFVGQTAVGWGSADKPAKLADDEYFVLGDFSRISKDSRLWEKGAPGHPPYAVPRSHLRGVVTHIYWPSSRWRAFR
jgi:signal peptidase I